MITIKITELGNNKIGFYLFNQYNERISTNSRIKDREQKDRYINKLKKLYMGQGQSVYLNDETIK